MAGFAFLGVAGISESNAEEGLSKSPAFTETGDGHFTHQNGAPRIGAGEGLGKIATEPSEPGENSSDDSAVSAHGGIV
ncbi:hypothetical protein KGY79_12270 [Candidatus Bipolaricaulota bacterium]|nr:hypothetical protein [Candidatus Bipolaricaulota bacterium]